MVVHERRYALLASGPNSTPTGAWAWLLLHASFAVTAARRMWRSTQAGSRRATRAAQPEVPSPTSAAHQCSHGGARRRIVCKEANNKTKESSPVVAAEALVVEGCVVAVQHDVRLVANLRSEGWWADQRA